MKVIVTHQFGKDVDKKLSKEMQLKLADIIEELQEAPNLFSINNLKKLKGYKTSYRVKMGDYRIGLFLKKT